MEQYLEIGKITNVHGIMGEVRVQPWADSPEFLCQFKTLYVDKAHWPIEVERARVHKNMVILKLHGVTDVPSALAMRNAILYIDRKDVHLPEGAFFLADIYGLEVRDAETDELSPVRCWERWPMCSPCPPTTCTWSGAASGS